MCLIVIECLDAKISFRICEVKLFLFEVLQVSYGGLNGKRIIIM